MELTVSNHGERTLPARVWGHSNDEMPDFIGKNGL
jgi:hypothetical protein